MVIGEGDEIPEGGVGPLEAAGIDDAGSAVAPSGVGMGFDRSGVESGGLGGCREHKGDGEAEARQHGYITAPEGEM